MNDLAYDYQLYEEPNYEIIEGEKIFMSPAANPMHSTIITRLVNIFTNYIEDKKIRGAVFTDNVDVHLPDGKNTFIPDLCVICNLGIINRESAIYGVPDLVVEVLSRSTMKRDVGIKKNIYERNGVREYWIINPWSKTIEVYHLVEGKFKFDNVYQVFTEEEFNSLEEDEKAEVTYDIPVSIFEGFTVDVRKVFKWWN